MGPLGTQLFGNIGHSFTGTYSIFVAEEKKRRHALRMESDARAALEHFCHQQCGGCTTAPNVSDSWRSGAILKRRAIGIGELGQNA